MASTFSRTDSQYIQIRFKDANGKWRSQATEFRKDNIGDQRQAKLVARAKTDEERAKTRSVAPTEHWEDWVDGWMRDRYGGKPRTLKIYSVHWHKLLPWLRARGIHSPGMLSFRAAMEYRAWRMEEGDASNNLTIQELKFLSAVMNQAVRLGYAHGNPLLRMGLKRDPSAEKDPWSDAEIQLVAKATAALPAESRWMRVTFLLGLYQAARLRQCRVPLKDIDLGYGGTGRITYWKTLDGDALTKGDKPFTQPIDARLLPELKAIVADLKREKKKALCDLPLFPSIEWRRLLDSLGLTHLVHHGLRVTWITRAALSGRDGGRQITLTEAKRFVNHGSTSVHEIYQRLCADDLVHVPAAMNLPRLEH